MHRRFERLIAGFVFPALLFATVSVGGSGITQGFLGIPWSTDLRGKADLKYLYGKDNLRFYRKLDSRYTIGGAPVAQVIFGSHEHRFFAAYLIIDSLEAFDQIKNYTSTKYGPPDSSWSVASGLTVYKWKHGPVRMKLKAVEGTDRMKLAIYYAPIADAVNAAEDEARSDESIRFLPIERGKTPDAMPLLEF
jgi:hypothetical protein